MPGEVMTVFAEQSRAVTCQFRLGRGPGSFWGELMSIHLHTLIMPLGSFLEVIFRMT